jgi:hypothetical protein
MTEDAIIGKLHAVLSDEVDSECKVLYILAESRKLLDKYPPNPIPFALKLYCHWALHIDLSHTNTTLTFLKRIDEFVGSVLGGKQGLVLQYRMLQELVLLTTFREQLKNFLQAYGLPTAVCDDDARWHKFLKSYAGIIEDGSLSCPAKSAELNFVSEVTFNKGKTAKAGSYFPFDLSWRVRLIDGKTMTVEVQAEQLLGGFDAISHAISLH